MRISKMEKEKEEKKVLEHDLTKEDHDQFWEIECNRHPELPECKVYDD